MILKAQPLLKTSHLKRQTSQKMNQCFIDHITITAPTLEAGAELVFTTNDYIHGDLAEVHDDAKIVIAHENGVADEGTADGRADRPPHISRLPLVPGHLSRHFVLPSVARQRTLRGHSLRPQGDTPLRPAELVDRI